MKLDHYTIKGPMSLLEKVRKFYCEHLGLKEGFRPGFKRPGYWLYADGHALLHLIEGEVDADASAPSFMDHVALRSDALEQIRARLDAAGVEYRLTGIEDIGLTQLFVVDPAGVRVEINAAEPSDA